MLFLFVFLPASLVLYYIVNDKAKEYILLFLSIVFYALGSIQYVGLFIASIAITVLIGRLISRTEKKPVKMVLLIFGILINLGILVFYKYSDFIGIKLNNILSTEYQVKGLLLPLGISFYTFKAISYLVDVYTKKAELEANPIHDALYMSFFAQIQSGPLNRYNDMKHIDKDGMYKLFVDGVYRFIIGFNKKIIIANILSNITSEVFSTSTDSLSTSYAWLGSICFSLQLFFDFSGYSDMAIGISAMFGYKCRENFNYPYITESVSKFWRRWHISLSEWFRDYVYIPLGGSKTKAKWRVYFNLLVVWVLTGLWHGASGKYILWGLGYFVAIAFERLTNIPDRFKTRAGKVIYRLFSLIYINFLWVIFNAESSLYALRFIKCMLFICPKNVLYDRRALFLIREYWSVILIAIVLCIPIVPKIEEVVKKHKATSIIYEIIKTIVILGAFYISVSFVVAGQNNPFAYANF